MEVSLGPLAMRSAVGEHVEYSIYSPSKSVSVFIVFDASFFLQWATLYLLAITTNCPSLALLEASLSIFPGSPVHTCLPEQAMMSA